MGLWDSPTQISAISRSPVKIKLLIHCRTILSPSCPQPIFSATNLPTQHNEVECGLIHKAESPIVRV